MNDEVLTVKPNISHEGNNSITSFEELLLAQKNDNNLFSCHTIFVKMTGDLISALLLSQIVYWYSPSKKNGQTRLGSKKGGLYKQRADWYDEIGITPRQADSATTLLKSLGLITTELHRVYSKTEKKARTLIHYKLDLQALVTSYNAALSEADVNPYKEGGKVEKKKSSLYENGVKRKYEKSSILNSENYGKRNTENYEKCNTGNYGKRNSIYRDHVTETPDNRDDDLQSLEADASKGSTESTITKIQDESVLLENGLPAKRLVQQSLSEGFYRSWYNDVINYAKECGGLNTDGYEVEYDDWVVDYHEQQPHENQALQRGLIKDCFIRGYKPSHLKKVIDTRDEWGFRTDWNFKDVAEVLLRFTVEEFETESRGGDQ